MKHAVVVAGIGLLAACSPGKTGNPALPPVTMVSPDSANDVTARFSPDGTRLFWWQPAGGTNQLWTAGADHSNPTSVPVTSIADNPVGHRTDRRSRCPRATQGCCRWRSFQPAAERRNN